MTRFFLSRRILKVLAVSTIAGASLAPLTSFAEGNNSRNIEDIKKQLVQDPEFLSAIVGKLAQDNALNKQLDNVDEAKIRSIVKAYLIENPEIMIEVQDALERKQTVAINAQQKQVITAEAKKIFHSPEDAVFGNPNGKTTIVEFFDYNCGYCKRSFPDMMALLEKNPNIRFVMKDFPILGQDSFKTHIVARAFQRLMPEKYMDFHKSLLTGEGRATENKALKIATSLGANETKLRALMKDESLQKPMEENLRLAYQLGINGTPSYVVGNEVLMGAVGKDALLEALSHVQQ